MKTAKLLLLAAMMSACTACATMPQGYWRAPSETANRAQDDLECRALANQAAMGAGGWSSDRAIRAAFYDEAVQQYFNQCVESRGYRWVTR